jgi:hypothetical protein
MATEREYETPVIVKADVVEKQIVNDLNVDLLSTILGLLLVCIYLGYKLLHKALSVTHVVKTIKTKTYKIRDKYNLALKKKPDKTYNALRDKHVRK